jgi:hypothetical protein
MRHATTNHDRKADCQPASYRAPWGAQPVGERWVRDFLKRHDDLQSKWNRKHGYQRAKFEYPVLIRAGFKRVQDMRIQYGILD